MTESTHTPSAGRSPRRSAAASAAWKSGLLASGFGVVLLGWALLVRAESPTNMAALSQPQPNVLIAQAPAAAQSSRPQPASEPDMQVTVQSLPPAPVFRRPITRSRGS